MKGWLDKYNDGGPIQPNYNDASVSMSKDFVGDGYSNVGRNYSPAWGGQFEDGGELPIAQNGWLQKLENKVEGFMGRPMDRGTTYAHDDIRNKKSDELDTLRHAYTAIETSDAIKKATGNIPFISDQLAFVGTNALGAGHELTRLFKSTPDELRESGEDVINNFAGSLAGLVPFVSDSDKRKAIQYLSNKGILPDGTTAGRGRTYNVVNKKYAMGGSMPQFQPGGKTPIIVNDKNDPRLKAYNDSLTLHNKGKSYLKQGFSQQLYDYAQDLILYGKNKKIAPYKTEKGKSELFIPQYKKPTQPVVYEKPKPQIQPTSQAVIDWIEGNIKDENAPTRLGTSEDEKKYAMGGSMPGAVGFTYARTINPAPSNGPYAKKTKASAKDGIETTSSDPEVDTDIYSEINNSLFFNKNLINKNTVGSIKKEMSDYLRSPLYAQRQSNYPEQYTKVVEADDDQIKWIKGLNDSDEQKKYQDAIAKKKREERLHNLGTVPFNIHYKSIDPSWDKLNPNSANVFDNSYDPNEERLHLSGRNFPSVVAHELSHATARTPTDVDSMYTPGANNENFRVDSDRLNTRYWDSITGKRKGTFNVGTGLNTSETNQFIDLAKPLSGESSYIDPHYNKNAERVDFIDEQYGDLNGVRHLLHSKGITKSFGENLDEAKLEKALKNKEIKDDPLFKRFHYRYGTDNLIKLNNTIAANDIQQGTPIAQNGIEMKYYQQGLDWKPKSISRDGSQLVKLDQLTNFTNYNTKQPGENWLDKYQD